MNVALCLISLRFICGARMYNEYGAPFLFTSGCRLSIQQIFNGDFSSFWVEMIRNTSEIIISAGGDTNSPNWVVVMNNDDLVS